MLADKSTWDLQNESFMCHQILSHIKEKWSNLQVCVCVCVCMRMRISEHVSMYIIYDAVLAAPMLHVYIDGTDWSVLWEAWVDYNGLLSG